MSLLTVVQNASVAIGLDEPSLVIGSTETQVKRLLRLLYEVGDEVIRTYDPNELIKTHTITLVASQNTYALPGDFRRAIFQTHWDNTSDTPLVGPMSAQKWESFLNATTGSTVEWYWRVYGAGTQQFVVYPTPATGDAGTTLTFEYISTQWFLPPAWANGVVVTSGTYRSYDGNAYLASTTGITSGTKPADDTGVTFALSTTPYTTFLYDADIPLLDSMLLSYGLGYYFLRSKSLPLQGRDAQFYAKLDEIKIAKTGSSVINLSGGDDDLRLLDITNLPLTGYAGA